MILGDTEIRKLVPLSPCSFSLVNPASLNIRIGTTFHPSWLSCCANCV